MSLSINNEINNNIYYQAPNQNSKDKKRARDTEELPPGKILKVTDSAQDENEKTNQKIIAFEARYTVDSVRNRFFSTRLKDFNQETYNTLCTEATAMANYAIKNPAISAKIKANLTAKAQGLPVSDLAVYGKILVLSFKIARLVANPSYMVGVRFSTTRISKSGVTRPTPAVQLFNAVPMIYLSTGPNNQTQRKEILIFQQLGRGGNNNVSLVYHQSMQKEMAFRQLNFDKLQIYTPDELAAIEKQWVDEVKLHQWLLQLNTPGIVNLHDTYVSENPKEKAMLLERCNDDSKAFIEDGEEITAPQRISMFKQRVATLVRLHELNVVHGDYKLSNIFFNKDENENFTIKLGDFGAFEYADQAGGGNRGTHVYRPLDSFYLKTAKDDRAFYAKQCDAWAEGLVAYQIKYGKLTEHFDILNEVRTFVKTFYDLTVIKDFIFLDSLAVKLKGPILIPTTKYENRLDLLCNLFRVHPEAIGKFTFISKTENASMSTEDFLKYLHNSFLFALFNDRFSAIFNNICHKLINGVSGCDGNLEDKIIAGLLNPNIHQRSLLETAQKHLEQL